MLIEAFTIFADAIRRHHWLILLITPDAAAPAAIFADISPLLMPIIDARPSPRQFSMPILMPSAACYFAERGWSACAEAAAP
jgi:hypothetical protein